MTSDQTTPTVRYRLATPCLVFDDARAAIRWLSDAFGAEAHHVYDGPDDSVAHAEVWFGDACVMLGTIKPDDRPPNVTGQASVYIVVESAAQVDALHERVSAAGARMVIALTDTDYGSRSFSCLDPEGNVWSFGTYAATRE
jgi:uncharacterized glyoxalase superfamily protein PhnB